MQQSQYKLGVIMVVFWMNCVLKTHLKKDPEVLSAECQGKKYTLDMLSDEQLMQMLIQHVKNKKRFMKKGRTFKDLKDWPGVTLEDNHVVKIDWENYYLGGSMNLSFIPQYVIWVSIHGNSIEGSICASDLSSNLQHLSVSRNKFTGTIEWSKLPQDLENLYLYNNHFSGTVECSALPQRITNLWIAFNDFEGVLDLRSAPVCMKPISWYFEGNRFTETLRN